MSIWTRDKIFLSADKATYLFYDRGAALMSLYVNGTLTTSWSATTLGFYGTAAVARPTAAVAVASTAPTNSGAWGATTSTQFAAMLTAINTLIANLSAVGLQA